MSRDELGGIAFLGIFTSVSVGFFVMAIQKIGTFQALLGIPFILIGAAIVTFPVARLIRGPRTEQIEAWYGEE